MSAILSLNYLNDFISTGSESVCTRLPDKNKKNDVDRNHKNADGSDGLTNSRDSSVNIAQISLTDCLACSGCVTSAEAVLVSLQSHEEVIKVLAEYRLDELLTLNQVNSPYTSSQQQGSNNNVSGSDQMCNNPQLQPALSSTTPPVQSSSQSSFHRPRLLVMSISPQSRASIAATLNQPYHAIDGLLRQIFLHRTLSSSTTPPIDNLRLQIPEFKYSLELAKFAWIIDTSAFSDLHLLLAAQEVNQTRHAHLNPDKAPTNLPQSPVLASACPGWICYAEKTHPSLIKHISHVKSPQALAGSFVKSLVNAVYGIKPWNVWHVTVMPCFDKKLEASRSQLNSASWLTSTTDSEPQGQVCRDIDCVITTNELFQLLRFYNIDLIAQSQTKLTPSLPHHNTTSPVNDSVPTKYTGASNDFNQITTGCVKPVGSLLKFPVPELTPFFDSYDYHQFWPVRPCMASEYGTSGGAAVYIARYVASLYPDAQVTFQTGRNSDVTEIKVIGTSNHSQANFEEGTARRQDEPIVYFSAARYNGFRNIQNLVRKLKTSNSSLNSIRHPLPHVHPNLVKSGYARRKPDDNLKTYDFIEVMACPGGCTNGGGQIKLAQLCTELSRIQTDELKIPTETVQDIYESVKTISPSPITLQTLNTMVPHTWLKRVDQVYHSASHRETTVDDITLHEYRKFLIETLTRWSTITNIPQDMLTKTQYAAVEPDESTHNLESNVHDTFAQVKHLQPTSTAHLAHKFANGW